jgi:prepilin-type N-terminal cleavage/methylation domain-containing protein
MGKNKRVIQRRHGFTLVEVLIVVVILGILAATVLPQFSNASEDAREAALVQDLQAMRSQIELYKFQHNGKYPGDGAGANEFRSAMLMASKSDMTTAAPGTAGFPYGPYFAGAIPPNPYNGQSGIMIVADVPGTLVQETALDAGNGELVGWIYNPATGRIKANCSGTASDGVTLLSEL